MDTDFEYFIPCPKALLVGGVRRSWAPYSCQMNEETWGVRIKKQS